MAEVSQTILYTFVRNPKPDAALLHSAKISSGLPSLFRNVRRSGGAQSHLPEVPFLVCLHDAPFWYAATVHHFCSLPIQPTAGPSTGEQMQVLGKLVRSLSKYLGVPDTAFALTQCLELRDVMHGVSAIVTSNGCDKSCENHVMNSSLESLWSLLFACCCLFWCLITIL